MLRLQQQNFKDSSENQTEQYSEDIKMLKGNFKLFIKESEAVNNKSRANALMEKENIVSFNNRPVTAENPQGRSKVNPELTRQG